jgi:hypothetical protein
MNWSGTTANGLVRYSGGNPTVSTNATIDTTPELLLTAGVNGTARFVARGDELSPSVSCSLRDFGLDCSTGISFKVGGTTEFQITTTQILPSNAGSAGTPSIALSTDTNTGIFFPAADTLGFAMGGVEDFRMEPDGDFHADGDVIAYSTTVSDRRLKDNIETIENALEKVSKLRGVRFDWAEQIGRGADIGLIAQEVEEVFPEIVTEKKRLKLEGLWKTVRYDALIGVLVEAIKELKAEVDELKKGK